MPKSIHIDAAESAGLEARKIDNIPPAIRTPTAETITGIGSFIANVPLKDITRRSNGRLNPGLVDDCGKTLLKLRSGIAAANANGRNAIRSGQLTMDIPWFPPEAGAG
jgi:hypothetical protein